jgi:CheY-like chemotaxis protein
MPSRPPNPSESPPPDRNAPRETDTPFSIARDGRPCRILIVEDDALIAFDLRQTVEELGGAVVGQASRTVDAIGLAAKHRPDVVLMDIRLGDGSDGIDAARGIRRLQEVPIIFVTGNSDDETRGRVFAFANVDLLNKPVDHMHLRFLLQERCRAR